MATQDNTRGDGQVQGDGDYSRRRFLQGTAAAGAAAVGIGTATTGVAGQDGGMDFIQIEEERGWFGGWSADDDLPVADELLVYIHGWFGDMLVSSQASNVYSMLQQGGYSPDEAVALEWPATTINYFGAESDTEDVGEVTAGLVEDFYDAGGGNVRLVGHSLGGRSVLWTLDKLSTGYEIETVAALGAAADGSEVCGSPWNDGLSRACEVRNYHSNNDGIVALAYGGSGDTALGVGGAGCDPAATYTDVDVTGSVDGHLDHLGNAAVGEDIAAAIESGTCHSDGGSGDDDSDSGSDDGGDWGSGSDGDSDDDRDSDFGWF